MYNVSSLSSLANDYKLFTLAPVYSFLDFKYDLVKQFRVEESDCNHIHVSTERPVIEGVLPQYTYFLEGVPLEYADALLHYIRLAKFFNKQTGFYSEITWQELKVADVNTQGIIALPELITYRVYLPTSNKARVIVDTTDIPRCTLADPDPKIISAAKIELNK